MPSSALWAPSLSLLKDNFACSNLFGNLNLRPSHCNDLLSESLTSYDLKKEDASFFSGSTSTSSSSSSSTASLSPLASPQQLTINMNITTTTTENPENNAATLCDLFMMNESKVETSKEEEEEIKMKEEIMESFTMENDLFYPFPSTTGEATTTSNSFLPSACNDLFDFKDDASNALLDEGWELDQEAFRHRRFQRLSFDLYHFASELQVTTSSPEKEKKKTVTKRSKDRIKPSHIHTNVSKHSTKTAMTPIHEKPEEKRPSAQLYDTISPITRLPTNSSDKTLESLRSLQKIGIYSPEARKERIQRFHEKRKSRVWQKRIKYDCRKTLAAARPRFKGRFVKVDETVSVASLAAAAAANATATANSTETVVESAPTTTTNLLSTTVVPMCICSNQ